MEKIFTPDNLEQALEMLAVGDKTPVAGCTDYLVNRRRGTLRPAARVSLDRLDELRGIEWQTKAVYIGSMVTFARLESEARMPRCLTQAASEIGSPQIRNRATIGGNIATASPAADMAVPLSVLNAMVHTQSLQGSRIIPLSHFLLGPGKTTLQCDELIVGFSFSREWGESAFCKLGKRRALAISVASLAVDIKTKDSLIREIAIAAGAVGPTVIRAIQTEAFLVGEKMGEKRMTVAAELFKTEISPISDIRASAEYRKEVSASILQMMLQDLTKED